jgi:pectate lyase
MMKKITLIEIILTFLFIVTLLEVTMLPVRAREMLAFPGAEGFGAYSKGGRGGKVLHVTNLDDDGEGSFRWAVEQEGPRTIVFDVSGTIKLKKGLTIKNPFITIAGQTAPGDGICLRDAGLGIAASDVIVRYLRCRLGDKGRNGDAISIGKGENIIVDHCSTSWSTDEVLSASTHKPVLKKVTVQWCFITEALNPRNHGYGSLIRGTEDARYTFHHNLYAHNKGRNPRPGNCHEHNPPDEDPLGLLLDFRNNVIYNFGGVHAGYNNDKDSVTRLNYVGNVLIPGESSAEEWVAYKTCSPNNRGYFADTMMDGTVPNDPWSVINFGKWTPEQIAAYKMTEPHETGPIRTDKPQVALERILATGGANLPKRDAVDTRVVDSVRNRTGSIIKSQEEVGGWPELKSLPAATDTDRDGMPDSWETANGLNPNDPEDRNGIGKGGYTRLEQYLNELCR